MWKLIEDEFKTINYRPSCDEMKKTLLFFSEERREVREMFEKLSWNENEDTRRKAEDYLVQNLLPCEYLDLVLPDRYFVIREDGEEKYCKEGTGKARWESAANVVIKLGWHRVEGILIPLFFWLLDCNWPGSETIWNFILSIPENVLCEKMKEILDNPQYYESWDYKDLKEQISDLCKSLKIVL